MRGRSTRLGPLGFKKKNSFLSRTGLVRFGLAGSGTPKPETELDIFLNILTGSIGFLYRFGYFG
jgi:hypothetical protein